MKKKTVLSSGFEPQPAENCVSLLYLNSCLLIAVPLTKQAIVFLGKCVQAAAKIMVADRKIQKALALLYLGSGPLRNSGTERTMKS